MTLRQLGNSTPNNLSLEEWMELAEIAGLTVSPDTELTDFQRMALKEKISEYITQKKIKNRAKPDEKLKQASIKALGKLIRENYIFVDISSLLSPDGERFLQIVLPFLHQYQKKLYVPNSVLINMDRWTNDASDPERAAICRKRINALKVLQDSGVIEIRDFSNKNDKPERDLLAACSHFRMKYSLLILTQNEELAADLMKLNQQRSVNGKRITVKRINKYGYLSNVIEKQETASGKIYISTKIREVPDEKLRVTMLPKSNNTVFVSPDCKGGIRLGEEMGFGGEGIIYRTNTDYVAKIYKVECCTAYRLEKLQIMIEADLEYKGICFPVSILYNQYGEFIGYLMQEAKGYPVQSSIFKKQLFQKKLPGWSKEDLVQCAITILFKFKYLHDHKILVGDINPGNILVASPLEVYFVDTDSYQINDLPCPVGFPEFTPPELHQKHRNGELHDYTDIMRTKSNEYFAVATLMFRLMMPGKLPYSQQGGEDMVDNILEMHLPYALGEKHGENVPDGVWRFIWSHLTHRMKNNFHKIFDKTEEKSDFNTRERLSVDNWILEMSEYQRVLQGWKAELDKFLVDNQVTVEDIEFNRIMCNIDPQSLVIYPNRLKRLKGEKYVKCLGDCGKEYTEKYMRAGYCSACQRKGETLTCIVDGKDFVFTNYEKYFRKFKKPSMCPECRRKGDEVFKEYDCATPGCYNKVRITRRTYAYYMKNGRQLPKYCPACNSLRDQKKNVSQQKSNPSERTAHSASSASTLKTSSETKGCFITTAVCEYFGKPDDCQELTDFRAFRDHWLRFQPGGEEQIAEYYECAPELVRLMCESPDYSKICNILWTDFLIPCQVMIHNHQFEECRTRYTVMMEYLRSILKQ